MARDRWAAVAAVMVGSFVAALDQTVVGTAMPTVIGELGGIERYGLVFSAYLLMATVTTPLSGRLSDVFGRKPVYLSGLLVFVLGSMLAGLSRSMDDLVAFRALQGMGAGALLPVGLTIIGDLFDVRQRARMQALFSTVWVTSAVVGPTIGGLLTQTLSWRWAFYVNLPIGLTAMAIMVAFFHETVSPHDRAIDWLGAAVFAAATISLLLGLNGAAPAPALAGAVALTVLFFFIERRVGSPLIDFALVRTGGIASGIALNAVVGVMLLAVTTYVPPFVQGVQGRQPAEAGLIVSSTSLGWSSGSLFMSVALLRLGPRLSALIGAASWAIGAALLTTLGPATPAAFIVVAMVLLGLGMGLTLNPVLVSVQSAVTWSRRGVATSLTQFSRSLGSAVGVALLGSVLVLVMGARADRASALLDPIARSGLAPGDAAPLRTTLNDGLHAVYVIMTGVAVAGAALAMRLPARLVDAPEAEAAVPAGGAATARGE